MHQRETVQRSTSERSLQTSSAKSWKSATSFSAGTRSSNDELVAEEVSVEQSKQLENNASDFGEGNVTSAQDRNSQELEGGELVEVSQILGHKIHWEIVALLIVMAILYL